MIGKTSCQHFVKIAFCGSSRCSDQFQPRTEEKAHVGVLNEMGTNVHSSLVSSDNTELQVEPCTWTRKETGPGHFPLPPLYHEGVSKDPKQASNFPPGFPSYFLQVVCNFTLNEHKMMKKAEFCTTTTSDTDTKPCAVPRDTFPEQFLGPQPHRSAGLTQQNEANGPKNLREHVSCWALIHAGRVRRCVHAHVKAHCSYAVVFWRRRALRPWQRQRNVAQPLVLDASCVASSLPSVASSLTCRRHNARRTLCSTRPETTDVTKDRGKHLHYCAK